MATPAGEGWVLQASSGQTRGAATRMGQPSPQQTIKNCLAQNANGFEVEEPCTRERSILLNFCLF